MEGTRRTRASKSTEHDHINSQRLRQYARGLHGLHQVLSVFIMAFSLEFGGIFELCKRVGLWFFYVILGSVSSICLSFPTLMC